MDAAYRPGHQQGCLNIDVASNQVVSTTGTPLTVNQAFLPLAVVSINQLVADTRSRAQSPPRRKADIQNSTSPALVIFTYPAAATI